MKESINNSWWQALKAKKLSQGELASLKRFSKAPAGRSFLPVALMLRRHGLVEEGLELLIKGLEHHPDYNAARVFLAREFLHKGMVHEAWNTLDEAKTSLLENSLAQRLKFILAILLGKEFRARDIYLYIKAQRLYDDKAKELGEKLESEKFQSVRETLIQQLKNNGIHPLLYSTDVDYLEAAAIDPKSSNSKKKPKSDNHRDKYQKADDKLIQGFYAVPLKDLFVKGKSSDKIESLDQYKLDKLTYANVLEEHGYYHKALKTYKQLLRAAPGSDFLVQKIIEINRKKRQQRDKDLSIDPRVADQMVAIEVINKKIQLLNKLLVALS